MTKVKVKLEVSGENYVMEVYETESGTLAFEMFERDDERHGGGYVEVDLKEFTKKFNETFQENNSPENGATKKDSFPPPTTPNPFKK